MARIFVSYSRLDNKFATKLVENLRSSGHIVWHDISSVQGGQGWASEINNNIRDCDIFIAILSPKSTSSQWVLKETLLALSLKKQIVPLLWRDTQIPVHLVDLQYIDFREGFTPQARRSLAGALPSANHSEVGRAKGTGTRHAINLDIVNVYDARTTGTVIKTLAWGDEVDVLKVTPNHVQIRAPHYVHKPDGSVEATFVTGFIRPSAVSSLKPLDLIIPKSDDHVLKIDLLDTAPGEASVLETPRGHVVLVDGGETQFLARYLASRYPGTVQENPKIIDCILVTHGDADHFSGLQEIFRSETNRITSKRFFMRPLRVYHNGLVRRHYMSEMHRIRKEQVLLGKTQKLADTTVITGLVTNLIALPDRQMTVPFQDWKAILGQYHDRHPIDFRRLRRSDDDAFNFLADESIQVEVLGPIATKVRGRDGLEYLIEDTTKSTWDPAVLRPEARRTATLSAHQTLNSHAINFRLSYGHFHLLYLGALDDRSCRTLLAAHEYQELNLRSEILKVPHHGATNLSPEFLRAVSPVVSIITGGANEAVEPFQPSATLLGALTRHSRVKEPLVFVMRLLQHFEMVGSVKDYRKRSLFAYELAEFANLRIRTDGNRMIVYHNSDRTGIEQAYAYKLNSSGDTIPVQIRSA